MNTPRKNQKALLLLGIVIVLVLTSLRSPIISVAIVILLAVAVVAVRDPKMALLVLFGTKPIIDATWAFRMPVLDLSMLHVTGVAFPILAFVVLYSNRATLIPIRHTGLFVVFGCLNALSLILTVMNNPDSFFATVTIFFQSLNSIAAYLIVPFLFPSKEDRKRLLLVWIMAGLFPMVTAYLQIFGLMQGRVVRTTGELLRISGLYYDSTNLRMYSIQTLFLIYMYLGDYVQWSRYRGRTAWLMLPLIPLALYVVYRGYSKAAIGIIASCFLLHSILRRQIILGSVLLVTVTLLYLTTETVESEITLLLRKEISYAEGTLNPEHEHTLLGGRFVRWEVSLERFEDADMTNQLFGVDYGAGIFIHSDFLRLLLGTGYVGLITYAVLLLLLVRSLWVSYLRYGDALSIGGFFALTSLIIDSTGLVPLLYPGYCWFCFGVISLAINRGDTTPHEAH